MNRATSLTCLALLAALSANAHAFENGTELFEAMSKGTALRQNGAMMFIAGTVDGIQEGFAFGHQTATGKKMTMGAAGRMMGYCLPRGVTNGQLSDAVKQYLTANPAERQRGATAVIFGSMVKAFPC
ncbi:Rap1a/Tai family immunity protein [Ramlibacter sp. WS9]|uniref:Rap1a/Tai family immunity protein n=1 Tax=Ramlibacter sp. WS9 TaxID=1882741 RepID=UPI001141213D|nr:Rap1a/Tai family immunity protein [Ramlibacter sp. WS9]ROZ79815.1 hypothetical protein EEB15_02665 [Ramlibacter sp. WS9]